MIKLRQIKMSDGGQGYMFYCPGCQYMHHINTERGPDRTDGPQWTFDGNMESPTFSPSLLVGPGTSSQCHLFVRGGKIQYLSDCWHKLKGQTIDMVDLESVPDA